MLRRLVLCVGFAVTLASCTTSKPGSAAKDDIARGARAIIGTSLIGARGATDRDQDKIDDTVAGACSVGTFNKTECRRHQEETE